MNYLTRLGLALVLASLSAAQTPKLEAWYRLDELFPPDCEDSSGSGHHGTFDGGTLPMWGARPETGTSVRFDGVDDKIDIPDGPGLTELRQELTAVCWINVDDFVGEQRFFGNDGSWTWGLNGGSLRFTTNNVADYQVSHSMQSDKWYHVAVVFDAFYRVAFYVDGAPLGLVIGPGPANPPAPEWNVAFMAPADPQWFAGFLDDIQVYDGVLTGEQVEYLFDHPGSVLAGPIGTSYCGPANVNSSGNSALISAHGNEWVGTGFVELSAEGCAANEIGYFLVSQTAGFHPFVGGTQGDLCLGGNIGRFNASVQGTGVAGRLSLNVDLADLPTHPHVGVMPGETWRFQAFFTDHNPGATANFSDAIEILFL